LHLLDDVLLDNLLLQLLQRQLALQLLKVAQNMLKIHSLCHRWIRSYTLHLWRPRLGPRSCARVMSTPWQREWQRVVVHAASVLTGLHSVCVHQCLNARLRD